MNLEALLARAQSFGVEGRLKEAQACLVEALALAPDDPRVLHLLGVTRWQQGELAGARELLERAAALTPDRAEAHFALARLAQDLDDPEAALSSLRRTVELAPDFAPAWADLGTALAESGDPGAAIDALQRARTLGADDAGVLYTLGQALRVCARVGEAVTVLRQALDGSASNPHLMHALALALRAAGEPEQALALLEDAARRLADDAQVRLDLAEVLSELGRAGDALTQLRAAVDAEPGHRQAIDALTRALWAAGEHETLLGGYSRALEAGVASHALRQDHAGWLVRLGRFEEALDVLQAAGPGDRESERLGLVARCLANTGDAGGAVAHFRAAVEAAPGDSAVRLDLARMLLMIDEPADALDEVNAVLRLHPHDQEAIAYLGLCWRFLGDPREAGLNDYRRLVRTYRIPVPAGYDDIVAFNRALARELNTLHDTAVHPVDQTLRGGTQTYGDLFSHDLPAIQAVRESISSCVQSYIDDMEADATHPLFSRRASGFRYAASWSCRLADAGFHTHHLHPKGWISSCYYVALPEAVRRDGREGWITFGESSLRLGERELEGLAVQPEEGLLVLFPSYMFHGTVPFHDEQPRMTIAFDVEPL